MLLEPQQRNGALFGKLPRAIADLCESCQEFAYHIRVPAEEEKVSEDFTIISYTMSILRGMSKLLTGSIRSHLESTAVHDALRALLGNGVWERWCKLSRKCMRSALCAFVIGEKGQVHALESQEAEFAGLSNQIRREVGESASYDRNASRAVRLVSLMQGFLAMAKEVAEGEEFTKKQTRYSTGRAFPEWKEGTVSGD